VTGEARPVAEDLHCDLVREDVPQRESFEEGVMRQRRPHVHAESDRDVISALATSAILSLHDRLIGRLDRPTRARVLRAARERGWDRSWDDGPLAA